MNCGSWSLLANETLGPFIQLWPMINGDLAGISLHLCWLNKAITSTCPAPSIPLLLYTPLSFPPPFSFTPFFFSVLFKILASHISLLLLLQLPFPLFAPSLIHLSAFNFPLFSSFSLPYCWVTVQLNCYWGLSRPQSGGTVCHCLTGRTERMIVVIFR